MRVAGLGLRGEGLAGGVSVLISPKSAAIMLPGCMVECLGFRFQGLGCRVEGLGFRVEVLGINVEGLGFRVQGVGFIV